MNTFWNKFYAVMIYFMGVGSILIDEGPTGFVVCLIIAAALYFAGKDVTINEICDESEQNGVYSGK